MLLRFLAGRRPSEQLDARDLLQPMPVAEDRRLKDEEVLGEAMIPNSVKVESARIEMEEDLGIPAEMCSELCELSQTRASTHIRGTFRDLLREFQLPRGGDLEAFEPNGRRDQAAISDVSDSTDHAQR